MTAFVLDGLIEVRHLATVPAAPLAPTQSELTAGTDAVGSKQAEELIDITGWEKSPSSIPLPGYAGRDVGSLAGENTYPQSTLVFRMDSVSRILYTLFVEGLAGYMGFAQDGLGVGEEAEIFPIEVASANRRKARNVANAFEVAFTISPPYKATQAA